MEIAALDLKIHEVGQRVSICQVAWTGRTILRHTAQQLIQRYGGLRLEGLGLSVKWIRHLRSQRRAEGIKGGRNVSVLVERCRCNEIDSLQSGIFCRGHPGVSQP